MEQLRTILKTSLRSRFRYIFKNDLFKAATFLNFNYRKFEFIKDDNERLERLSKSKDYIITNLQKHSPSPSNELTQPVTSSTPLLDITRTIQNSLNVSSSSSSLSIYPHLSQPQLCHDHQHLYHIPIRLHQEKIKNLKRNLIF